MILNKLNKIFYGADYNPDQWDEDTWKEDIRQMKIHGVNVVTLPVFSWAKLQPSEEEFDFSWLDKIIDMLYENGIYINMATPTAAQPAWMSRKYKEILPTDIYGRKRKHGGRTNFCPNSLNYRRLSRKIADKMAEHYKDHPALVLWHINNEYGTYCYCDTCAKAFRIWLKEKYKTLDELNKRWNTSFWGHTYYEWDEIEIPSALNEILPGRLGGRDGTNFQGMAVDYRRFMSDSILDCFRNEAEVIKKHTPNIPITTNIWGVAPHLDLFKWAKYCDIASWDNYPSNKEDPSVIAFRHDVIRGLKNGKPFLLMEQTPNQQNWQNYNALKRPGVMALLSYQSVAHGADGVMFFQWRQSIGACEKYHAAMVPHAGHENTRIGRELTKLGKELSKLQDKILDSRIEAKVAIIMDWSNWWAVEYSSGPSIDLTYFEQVQKYYKAFYELNIPVDIIEPSGDLSKYDIVIAPVLYMVEEKVKNNIEKFVDGGGTFITTFFSGIIDENDLVILGGYPGAFRKLLGIWVEETDALFSDMSNEIILNNKINGKKKSYECKLICDVIHLEGAEELAQFGKDYYKGYASITENKYGKGKAVYVATEPEEELIELLIKHYCDEKSIKGILKSKDGIEVTKRTKEDKNYIFILNHNNYDTDIDLGESEYLDLLSGRRLHSKVDIKGKGVYILEELS